MSSVLKNWITPKAKNLFDENHTNRIAFFFGSVYNVNQLNSMAYDAVIYKYDEDINGPKSGVWIKNEIVCVVHIYKVCASVRNRTRDKLLSLAHRPGRKIRGTSLHFEHFMNA